MIAWHISAKPDVELVMTAFQKAYEARNAPDGLMVHSDRGSQYTAFRQLLDSLNVVQSFSKKDTLLTMLSVFSYIEGYYNSKRPHNSLGYLTLNEMEASYLGRRCFFLSLMKNYTKLCLLT